ncbi:MAG: hypothetical protein HC875_14375 [Anaerolineales bacterium]|nr:hypothetical protein [Anaerolineales bacterium]
MRHYTLYRLTNGRTLGYFLKFSCNKYVSDFVSDRRLNPLLCLFHRLLVRQKQGGLAKKHGESPFSRVLDGNANAVSDFLCVMIFGSVIHYFLVQFGGPAGEIYNFSGSRSRPIRDPTQTDSSLPRTKKS